MTSVITIPQTQTEQIKLAAQKAVNKVWGRVQKIWDATPAFVRWTIGFTGLFAVSFLYGYAVATVLFALFTALGLSAEAAYVLTMCLTLGSFYGLMFACLAAMD